MNENDKPPTKRNDYHAYLLRIWHEDGRGWRVSLQPADSQERHGFTDLYSAMTFVEQALKEGQDERSS